MKVTISPISEEISRGIFYLNISGKAENPFSRLDPGKTEISRQSRAEWYNRSPELLLSEKRLSFPGLDPDQNSQKATSFRRKKHLNKQQKFTQIYFNEADPMMEITTHNTDLKKRLKRFAEEFPELCRVTEIDGGKMSFEIDKHRCSLRLTKPYSQERLETLREAAQETGFQRSMDS